MSYRIIKSSQLEASLYCGDVQITQSCGCPNERSTTTTYENADFGSTEELKELVRNTLYDVENTEELDVFLKEFGESVDVARMQKKSGIEIEVEISFKPFKIKIRVRF